MKLKSFLKFFIDKATHNRSNILHKFLSKTSGQNWDKKVERPIIWNGGSSWFDWSFFHCFYFFLILVIIDRFLSHKHFTAKDFTTLLLTSLLSLHPKPQRHMIMCAHGYDCIIYVTRVPITVGITVDFITTSTLLLPPIEPFSARWGVVNSLKI